MMQRLQRYNLQKKQLQDEFLADTWSKRNNQ